MKELLVLAKLKHLEQKDDADLFVLDAPATGHAYTFLTSSHGLVNAARGGPLRTQAEQVVELLGDPARCQVLLVTIPEETPVNEAVETAYRLEDEIGIALGPVVVNGCFADLEGIDADATTHAITEAVDVFGAKDAERLGAAARFREARETLQRAQIERLLAELPLPQIRLPDLLCADFGPRELEELASCLEKSIGELK
jgi:anion-transporting  ArsA/GET3 family ATPase